MEFLEHKLYNPRNIEGKSNTEDIQDIRYLENKLSQIPEFVSLSLQGSVVKGYSEDKTSDVDLTVLFDSGGIKQNSKDYQKLREEMLDVAQETKLEIWHEKKRKKQKPKNFQFRFVDLNKDVMEGDFPSARFKKLALLFSLSTGKQIESYRKHWINEINSLSVDEREQWVSEISCTLAEKTDMDYETLEKRIDINDKGVLLEKRKKLWRKRIENFLTSEE